MFRVSNTTVNYLSSSAPRLNPHANELMYTPSQFLPGILPHNSENSWGISAHTNSHLLAILLSYLSSYHPQHMYLFKVNHRVRNLTPDFMNPPAHLQSTTPLLPIAHLSIIKSAIPPPNSKLNYPFHLIVSYGSLSLVVNWKRNRYIGNVET